MKLGEARLWAPASLPRRWRASNPLASQDAGRTGVQKNAQGNRAMVVSLASV